MERILHDIGRKNFHVPEGFKLTGNSTIGSLSIKRKQNRITWVNRIKHKYGSEKLNEELEITQDGIRNKKDGEEIFIPAASINQIYYHEYYETHEIVRRGNDEGSTERDYIEEKLFSLYIDYNDTSGKSIKYVLLDKLISQYMARYIEQEAEKILAIKDVAVKNDADGKIKKGKTDDRDFEIIAPSAYDFILRTSEKKMKKDAMINAILRNLGYFLIPLVIVSCILYYILCPEEFNTLWICILVGIAVFCFWLYGKAASGRKVFKYGYIELSISEGKAKFYEKNLSDEIRPVFEGNMFDIDYIMSYEIEKMPFNINSRYNDDYDYDKNYFKFIIVLKDGKKIPMFEDVGISSEQAEFISDSVNEKLVSVL